ncbi:TPA: nucleotidyltransferase domain-containing protein [Candidatus Woesearchaeota archaeon]|nr:nucleotidyltransferase domain-containing protein [Candidatus Woesearchaeota archaeon]HIH31476.1 nucleotidyltransferase domain-containing protein [Candidatus Woesearchaeota archaeon]HIH55239.1 nucleotidyltransferase domain-containing protein [Candidatus Woesearchaeota archaeon]HIJ01976.1 nucleotidyltransferase domain-containing protein [Candidatus Woesearchaeota archaeon]HIJ14523.1 nucleotidyltransferase domain-containing protein [Candidatus Woesearchaeota archaeon]
MLNKLRKILKSEKNKSVFDIVLYGSATRSEQRYNDIDIAVIFLEGDLNYRLEAIEKIKDKVKPIVNKLDIKQMLLKDFFSASFLARTGIILEGISLLDGIKISEKLGFRSYGIFFYTLDGLNHTEKIKFNYILSGRTTKGLLDQLKGTRMTSGAIKILVENSLIFKEVLDKHKIKYSWKKILEEM